MIITQYTIDDLRSMLTEVRSWKKGEAGFLAKDILDNVMRSRHSTLIACRDDNERLIGVSEYWITSMKNSLVKDKTRYAGRIYVSGLAGIGCGGGSELMQHFFTMANGCNHTVELVSKVGSMGFYRKMGMIEYPHGDFLYLPH